ncbi:hypothetical protein CDCA_CDCA15G4050 [Cyanidium caldarium]|uniref:Uncharacterized protein n=1 Tax=Cyanidium caldarium TaxID=2771 RepID=A0AAV9J0B2_CYACA|nr:hypothetical protein CDCA_CDCA15G4050 [Cyanidium caldarium]
MTAGGVRHDLAIAFRRIEPDALPRLVPSVPGNGRRRAALLPRVELLRHAQGGYGYVPRDWVQHTQNLMERCMLHYLDEAEIMVALADQANISPAVTLAVLQGLERQNKVFFAQYWRRVRLRHRAIGPPVEPWAFEPLLRKPQAHSVLLQHVGASMLHSARWHTGRNGA